MIGTAILPDVVLTMDAAHCASFHGDGNSDHLYSENDITQKSAEVYSCFETRVRVCLKLIPCDFAHSCRVQLVINWFPSTMFTLHTKTFRIQRMCKP